MLFALLGASASCTYLPKLGEILSRNSKTPRGDSPLVPLPETGVALDVYAIYVPYDRRGLLEQFWDDVEENEVPIEVRNSLYQHGLRQGLLPSKIPVSLERLLELRDIPPQRPFEKVVTAADLAKGDSLHKSWGVQMMKDQPFELPTCDPIPKLPILAMVDDNLSGHVYSDAKGILLISTDERPDGSVVVKTVPEIHYGEDTKKYTSVGGKFQHSVFKQKITFDQLTVETKLLLGQWVVIGPEMRQSAGFGHDILSRDKGIKEHILIAIRLRQTRKDGIHDRNDLVVLRIPENENQKRQNDEDHETYNDFPESISDQELGKSSIIQSAASLFDK